MPHHTLVRLKSREGRRVRGGAPWVFSNEIELSNAVKALAPGALVNVAVEDGRILGTGYFNPKSLIAVRLLSTEANAEIGHENFRAADRPFALALREAFYARPFYRLVHAEGDGLPGLTIDRFGDTLVVQITTAGMDALIGAVACSARCSACARQCDPAQRHAGARAGRSGRICPRRQGRSLARRGRGKRRALFRRSRGGQKTGWYYDQRDNRAFMAALAKGRSVLDAYCYTGGFGVAGGQGRRARGVGIDSSQPRWRSRRKRRRQQSRVANSSRPMCSRNSNVWPRRRRRSTSSSPIRRPS